MKDKNVDCFFINFIIEKARSQLAFSEQLQVSPLQYNSIQDNIYIALDNVHYTFG